jgi:hypothetical protein
MTSPEAHAYPADLAAHVALRWRRLALGRPLPPRAQLEALLSTAFQASLLRDEERPVTLRILVADAGELPLDGGPPFGLLRLAFDHTRAFTVEELRRISPAAKYHRSLLGVSVAPDGELAIWGIAQSGPRWLQSTHGGRAHVTSLPDALVIRVTGPGRLFIACGSINVAGLNGGKLTDGAMDVFASEWLPERFAEARQEIAALHREAAASTPVPWGEVDFSVVGSLSQQMVKRVLANIRSTHHGGMLVLLPPECSDGITTDGAIRMKYACSNEEPRRRFRTLLLAVMRVLATAAALAPPWEGSLGWGAYRGWHSPDLAAFDEAIFEMAHLIAALANVDGAVVLTKRFEVLGFGGEITGDLPEITTVERALDLEGTVREPEVVDAVGTRHRSAYRLCARFHEALAIVVSQDGGVRFVAWKDGAVTYWDHASLGAEEA